MKTFDREYILCHPGIIVLENELQEWIRQFPERGSTWTEFNQKGDAFITFAFGCRTVLGIAKAIGMMREAIQQEADKTGIISIRLLPEIVNDEGQWAVIARIVSYRGQLSDEQITPDNWQSKKEITT